MAGCASSTGIGVLTSGVGVRRDSTGPLGTGAALLTALVWGCVVEMVLCQQELGYYLMGLGLDWVKLVLCPSQYPYYDGQRTSFIQSNPNPSR